MLIPKISRAALAVLLLCVSTSAFAGDRDPVSTEKFNRLVKVMQNMYREIHQLEEEQKALQDKSLSGNTTTPDSTQIAMFKQQIGQLEVELKQLKAGGGTAAAATKDGAVNLDDMDSAPAKTAANDKAPILKVYFDLNLYSQPGGPSKGSNLTFDNFHSMVLLDVMPNEDIHFSTSIESPPKFYELDYKLSNTFTIRLGKIWIPFDDMNPHNIFGGMTNVSRITIGDSFLPDLFTDLGVGLHMKILDGSGLSLDGDAYVVNGFQSGGTDPVTSGSLYPDFSTLPTAADNNTNKAYGGRAHALIGRFLGIGTSAYVGRWTNKGDENRHLSMFGVDGQLYMGSTTLRAGVATMNVKLPSTSPNPNYFRNGSYVELGQKFGANDQFTFLLRGGSLNLDNRIVDRNDKEIGAVKLLWKPNLIEWSIEHAHDFKTVGVKQNYNFTNFRVIASF